MSKACRKMLLYLVLAVILLVPHLLVVECFSSLVSPLWSSRCRLTDAALRADRLRQDSSGEMGAWVPMGSCSSFSGLTPLSVEIMGTKYVVWESNGAWSVLHDECPHRLAPLSQGRVDATSGCIECPYHGWQFDKDGSVIRIPQLDEGENSKISSSSLAAQSLSTHVTGDLLWAFFPTEIHGESFPKSVLPEEYYEGLLDAMAKGSAYYTRDFPYSFDLLIENGLDGPAHVPFAHNKIGFRRSDGGPTPMEIVASNFTHLVAEVSYSRRGERRTRRYGFQRPFLVTNQQQHDDGSWRPAILLFVVPIREGQGRLISTLDALAPHPSTPQWLMHLINQKFFEGDIWLHNTEVAIRQQYPNVPKYLHASSSDISVTAWRQWWSKYGLSSAPRNTFGAAHRERLQQLPRKDLVDPWESHTKNCARCRRVLRRCKLAEKISVAFGLLSLVLLRQRQIASGVVFASIVLVNSMARRLIRELEGSPYRSHVGDRSFSAAT